VTFAGNDRKTNKTVVIQHADNSTTTYGYLQSIDVHLYQSIQSNQRLGTFVSTQENRHLYFSIEKDNQYIDPVQVIQVDDRSHILAPYSFASSSHVVYCDCLLNSDLCRMIALVMYCFLS